MKRNFIIIGLVVFLLFVSYGGYLLRPAAAMGDPQTFVVESGEDFRSITSRLFDLGLIRSENVFLGFGKIFGVASQAKPGRYLLLPTMTVPEIARIFYTGPNRITVTIFEGETIIDIDAKLARAGVLKAGTFLQAAEGLEGFMFPDTYQFIEDSRAEDVVRRLRDTFHERVADAFPELVHTGIDKENKEFYNALIVASLVEREVPESDDRFLVAGVIYKRLGLGMAIQVDPTVAYAACGGTYSDCSLTRSDYKIDSPYNTYLYPGLPPTPIANPGVSALRAALNPRPTEFLFYLSDPKTRRTIFSETFEEHNENRARYLGL